jgi:hypothetical protein
LALQGRQFLALRGRQFLALRGRQFLAVSGETVLGASGETVLGSSGETVLGASGETVLDRELAPERRAHIVTESAVLISSPYQQSLSAVLEQYMCRLKEVTAFPLH